MAGHRRVFGAQALGAFTIVAWLIRRWIDWPFWVLPTGFARIQQQVSGARNFRIVARPCGEPRQELQKPMQAQESFEQDLGDDFLDDLAGLEDMSKFEKEVDGQKYVWCRKAKGGDWVKLEDVGTYRWIDRGYVSKGEDGKWVAYAQMPNEVSHLTEAQRARLIRELRGDMKMSMADDDELSKFAPMPETPPLDMWPFHEASITEEFIMPEKEIAKEFKILDMTNDYGKAFFLGSRWKSMNEGRRALGYGVNDEIEDVAQMNAAVIGLKVFLDQIKLKMSFSKLSAEEQAALPNAVRMKNMRITGILGTSHGSAIAIWRHNAATARIKVDMCIGDDSAGYGPYAEEKLLRFIMAQGADLGAKTVWARTRRSESGKVIPLRSFKKLGFSEVSAARQEEEDDDDDQGLTDDGSSAMTAEEEETVGGLKLWLATRGLDKYLAAANEWCREMGAVDISEVALDRQDLAEYLVEEHGMTENEQEDLLATT